MSQALGARCTRCSGTGWVDAETEGTPVDKDGWLSQCPYFDVSAKVECCDGVIVPLR